MDGVYGIVFSVKGVLVLQFLGDGCPEICRMFDFRRRPVKASDELVCTTCH